MLSETLRGMALFLGYLLSGAAILVTAKLLLKPPSELFRKMLHILYVLSIWVLLLGVEQWQVAVAVLVILSALIYIAIGFLQRIKGLTAFLQERSPNEIRNSAVLAFCTMAVLIAVFWGGFGTEWKFIVAASIMGWGFGDAAAALVGKAVGRHHVKLRCVEGAKTWEGSGAMFVVSAVAIFITLVAYGALSWQHGLIIALITAPFCSGAELVSHRGMDTIIVPFTTAAVLYALVQWIVI